MVTADLNSTAPDDNVVISGFSGLFPMSDNIDELRENLFSMADLVQPMEDHKWINGGFLNTISMIGIVTSPELDFLWFIES
jgi:hypothetical protein